LRATHEGTSPPTTSRPREAVFSILLLIIIVIVVLALLGFFGARGRSV
jgi:hypothetical protein